MLGFSVFLIDWKLKCCSGNSLYLGFWVGVKCRSKLGVTKKNCFHTSRLLSTQIFSRTNFVTAIKNLCNLCYFCCSKMYFFMTVELPYSQHNNLMSFISQVLIDSLCASLPLPPLPAGVPSTYAPSAEGLILPSNFQKDGTWQGLNF